MKDSLEWEGAPWLRESLVPKLCHIYLLVPTIRLKSAGSESGLTFSITWISPSPSGIPLPRNSSLFESMNSDIWERSRRHLRETCVSNVYYMHSDLPMGSTEREGKSAE